MKEYLKDANNDKIYNNGMTILVSIITIIAITIIGLSINSKEYLLPVIIILLTIIILLPLWFIDKKRRKRIANRQKYYVIKLEKNITYNDIIKSFSEINNKIKKYEYDHYTSIISFKKSTKYRILIIHQDEFNFDNYKKTRKKINHLYNEKYNIETNISLKEANSMFELNIIHCDNENNELYTHISKDANHHLHRVVGMLDVIIIGNKLIIPSIRDNCNPPGINHYIKVNKLLFKLFKAIN